MIRCFYLEGIKSRNQSGPLDKLVRIAKLNILRDPLNFNGKTNETLQRSGGRNMGIGQ